MGLKSVKKSILYIIIYTVLFLCFLKFVSIYYSNSKQIEVNAYRKPKDSPKITKNLDRCPIPKYIKVHSSKESLLTELKCPDVKKIVTTKDGAMFISAGYSSCRYNCIVWKTDFESQETKWKSFQSNMSVPCPYFITECQDKSKNLHQQFILTSFRNETLLSGADVQGKFTNKKKDVMIVGIDSMSYQSWKYYLPKTFAVFHEALNGVSFAKFNTMGDGTTVNLQAMLTGTKDTETYETRRRIPGSKSVDDYRWIWRECKQKGYITFQQEDMTNYGTFQYRLNGFQRQPTDFYTRTGQIYAEAKFVKKLCLGNESYEKVQIDLLRDFNKLYKNVPTFSFSFLGYFSHDDNKLASYLDNDLSQFLVEQRKLYPEKYIILYSDHGHRFNSRLTMEGKYEERLPFMGLSFPRSMETSEEAQHLKKNSASLTTGLDLHATLQDILGTYVEEPNKKRHQSLLRPIAPRSCLEIQSLPHWCACLRWTPVQDSSISMTTVTKAAHAATRQISEFTASARSLCAPLTLHSVQSALVQKADSAVLAFRQSADMDGFQPDLSDTMTQLHTPVRLVLVTEQGRAQFEVTVTLRTGEGNSAVIEPINFRDVSRINRFAPWIGCLKDHNLKDIKAVRNNSESTLNVVSDIRKFCICHDAILASASQRRTP